jgi:hypothetical protein
MILSYCSTVLISAILCKKKKRKDVRAFYSPSPSFIRARPVGFSAYATVALRRFDWKTLATEHVNRFPGVRREPEKNPLVKAIEYKKKKKIID